MDDAVAKIYGSSNAEEIDLALEQGALKLMVPNENDLTDMESYLEAIKELLADPRSHCLMDGPISGLVTAMIKEGIVTPHRLTLNHAGSAAAGTGMIARLPVFPEAKVGAILDVRREMSESLVRYRRAASELANRLTSGPFDAAVQHELDDIWVGEVQPAIAQIEGDLSKSRLVKDVASSVFRDASSWAGSVAGGFLTMGVADLSSVPGLLTSGAVGVAVEAGKLRAHKKASARTDQLYYLFEVNQKL